jgi:hypothetical protein
MYPLSAIVIQTKTYNSISLSSPGFVKAAREFSSITYYSLRYAVPDRHKRKPPASQHKHRRGKTP